MGGSASAEAVTVGFFLINFAQAGPVPMFAYFCQSPKVHVSQT